MPISNPRLGDIVGVPFPFADAQTDRFRPALMVWQGDAEAPHPVVWAVMITSAPRPAWPGDIALSNTPGTGLTRPSIIRPMKLTTLDVALIRWIAGRAPEAELALCLDWLAARFPPAGEG